MTLRPAFVTVLTSAFFMPTCALACGAGSGNVLVLLIPFYAAVCFTVVSLPIALGIFLALVVHHVPGRIVAVGSCLWLAQFVHPVFIEECLFFLQASVAIVCLPALILPWQSPMRT